MIDVSLLIGIMLCISGGLFAFSLVMDTVVLLIISSVMLFGCFIWFHYYIDKLKQKNTIELEAKVEKFNESIIEEKESQTNILRLMLENSSELRDYFTISKSQAKHSFWLAVATCLFGFGILGFSAYSALKNIGIEVSVITGISGAITEAFACTSMLVHKKSLEQLNIYYRALHDNEMFLSTVHLVSLLTAEKQDEVYKQIIENELKVRFKTYTKPYEVKDETTK